ncbi:MAG: hypothetical protein IPG50_27745 [Myxococcales bacterium]|nr:hypothetical protein [Myxococcales bacterium]
MSGVIAYASLAADDVAPCAARPNPFTPLLDILKLGFVPRRWDREGFALVVALV